jgi:hypothetical protein
MSVVRRLCLGRLVAAISIFAVLTSTGESLVGELRDGEVHHESVAKAMSHHDSMGLRSDHGHEDGGAAGHRHGSNHEHGTNADHCTHVHAAGLIATFSWAFDQRLTSQTSIDSTLSAGFFTTEIAEPPRA